MKYNQFTHGLIDLEDVAIIRTETRSFQQLKQLLQTAPHMDF